MTHRSMAQVVLSAMFLLTAACATPNAHRAELEKLANTSYACTKPLDDVWPQAKQLLHEKGYDDAAMALVKTSDPKVLVLSTDFRPEYSSPNSAHEVRYTVVGKQLAGGHSLVRVLRVDRLRAKVDRGMGQPQLGYFPFKGGYHEPSSVKPDEAVRDLELEWKLMQRVQGASAER